MYRHLLLLLTESQVTEHLLQVRGLVLLLHPGSHQHVGLGLAVLIPAQAVPAAGSLVVVMRHRRDWRGLVLEVMGELRRPHS